MWKGGRRLAKFNRQKKMTSKAFSFTSGTWPTSYNLHPVVDDVYGSSGSNGVYRWDIQSSSITEYAGSGYVLQYDGSQTEPWSVASSVWGGTATISRPSSGVIRVTSSNIDRGTWTETDAFLNGVLPSSSGGGPLGGTVYVQDAKIVNYGGLTGFRFEQRGYPAASYELIGPGASSTWTLTSQTNNLQHHISNLSAGTYYLWQDSVQVATLIARTKVFCNFW